jgi:hypothetical protein
VGIVGPADIQDLQKRVRDYRERLMPLVASAPLTPAPSSSPFTIIDWQALVERSTAFEDETITPLNPLDYLFSSSQYNRGRSIIVELDKWRDELMRLHVPAVPQPIPVPESDIGILEAAERVVLAVLGFYLWKTLR